MSPTVYLRAMIKSSTDVLPKWIAAVCIRPLSRDETTTRTIRARQVLGVTFFREIL